MKEQTNNLIRNFIERNPNLAHLEGEVVKAVELLTSCVKSGNKIMTCGNGGSAADSEHIAGELLKGFLYKRPVTNEYRLELRNAYGEEGDFIADNLQSGIKCIPLTSFCAYNTAFLNDCNGDLLFGQLVNGIGDKGDVLIAISTSGNSKNVLYAAKIAKIKGIKIIGLTGDKGGKLREIADVTINVPSNVVYLIQEYHLPVYHILCAALESEIFDC